MDQNNRIEKKLDELLEKVNHIKTELAVSNHKYLVLEQRVIKAEEEIKKIREEVLPARKFTFFTESMIKFIITVVSLAAGVFAVLKYFKGA